MKTYLKYGAAMTAAGFVVIMVCYIVGLWEPANLGKGLIIGVCAGLAIQITGIVLGTRQVRAATGKRGFTYGEAFKAGFMIALCGALCGIVSNFIFFKFVNPNYNENMIAWTKSMMEGMNAPEARIEKAEEDMRAKGGLDRQLINGVVGGIVLGTIISLITAAIMKRPPEDDFSEEPPPIA